MMKIVPNINMAIRVTYLILGLGLVLTPFLVNLPIGTSMILPLLGVGTMASGASGF